MMHMSQRVSRPGLARLGAVAGEIARETKSQLILLHVLDASPEKEWIAKDPARAISPGWLESNARERLALLAPEGDPHAELVVRAGRPHREILRLAVERATGLIVMGIHGRGAINLMLFGSTTKLVIRESRCPVLTVRTVRPPAPKMEMAAALEAAS